MPDDDRRGGAKFLFAIDVVDGLLRLVPVASHDVLGDYDRWTYRLNLAGPGSQALRERVPAEGVVHLTYAVDPETPWRGYGPSRIAGLAGRLTAETVAAFADEASGPRGSFLPSPGRTDRTARCHRTTLSNSNGLFDIQGTKQRKFCSSRRTGW